jgi:cell division protein FtsI/penicillin-binding protein 2
MGNFFPKPLRKALLSLVMAILVATTMFGATVSSGRYTKSKKVAESASAQKKISKLKHSRATVRTVRKGRKVHRVLRERFYTSSFAEAQTAGDLADGEDPIVRRAAIDALGNMNGSVVAIDPSSGRILAMVNQKVALGEGAIPCSTIKVAVALAALSEGIVTKDTKVNLGGWHMDMTQALTISNNTYFETLGRKLGFEKVSHYAHEFGLGEMAGWDIDGEHLGIFPSEELSAKLGGVGRMCSFGQGISMTPLQLGALMSAIANGGTLYYLQHPKSPEEATSFTPKVKRYLEIKSLIPEVNEGMMGAVRSGTARSLRYNFSEEEILGKTGTCSESGTRYGWFASYANTQYGRIVVVVFLQGGRSTFGPKAAELAGVFYRGLYDQNYFAAKAPVTVSTTTSTTPSVGAQQ